MYLLCLLLLPLPALAAPLNQDISAFKPWFITCLAVLLIGAVVFLLARKRARGNWRSGAEMRIQSVLSLGMKEKLVLVQVEDQRLLLGITPQQITLISNLTRENPQASPAEFAQVFETLGASASEKK
ncbi:flagellar biosynthetic protein FliO [Citrobacter sp. Awk 4]|uniref:flagellar biosynthetic protein FliO n=1 Tax=Citrobacter sp. Awk 4 TaxID=2963955 RepID=UPI0023023EF9|nr:flagellar biosynthetic protein FliO [Citrobacter sp. Awk 4]MDA8479966.1 flagellar biosynthetic protein FliO [Citrobacter sp. Awk 4]